VCLHPSGGGSDSHFGLQKAKLSEYRRKIDAVDNQMDGLRQLLRELERDVARGEDVASGVMAARAVAESRVLESGGDDEDDDESAGDVEVRETITSFGDARLSQEASHHLSEFAMSMRRSGQAMSPPLLSAQGSRQTTPGRHVHTAHAATLDPSAITTSPAARHSPVSQGESDTGSSLSLIEPFVRLSYQHQVVTGHSIARPAGSPPQQAEIAPPVPSSVLPGGIHSSQEVLSLDSAPDDQGRI
jgi:hypothetical protein